jgi:hypothetical protein
LKCQVVDDFFLRRTIEKDFGEKMVKTLGRKQLRKKRSTIESGLVNKIAK